MTAEQASWVVSIVHVGNFLWAIPAGYLSDLLGRKVTLLLSGPVLLATWAIILATRTVEAIYVARLLQGIPMATVYTVLPMYLGEIAGPAIRGSAGYMFPAIWYAGTVYEYAVGPYVTYQQLAWISAIPPIVFLATFIWMPESPYYYLMKENTQRAEESLRWLRGGADIEAELEAMKRSVEEERRTRTKGRLFAWRKLLCTPEGRTSLTKVTNVQAVYQICGGGAMFSYATNTFTLTERASSVHAGVTSDQMSILMASLVLLLVPFGAVASDKLGRRPVLMISTIGATIFLALTTIYYYLLFETSTELYSIFWIPYFSIICYTLMVACGTESIIPVLQTELFSNETRGTGSAILFLENAVLSFFILKAYQPLVDGLGLHFLYGSFAIGSLLGSLYVTFCVPETKGMTFDEIQRTIAKKRTVTTESDDKP
ncbi:hypothetical protein AAG570_004758 [Ranatra chinensis]|uniref:Major facilitator superfamily (MFS) profile domain-containing protein n=1 Tax=Ranatra chinensis TaxID=642074 RepID=A0ABD0Y2I3_9HEMI